MDLMTPVFSPTVVFYGVLFSLIIGGGLRWKLKSGFGAIFGVTSLFSVLLTSVICYVGYVDIERIIASEPGAEVLHSHFVTGLATFCLVNLGICLASNAVIAWLLQTRNTNKLGL